MTDTSNGAAQSARLTRPVPQPDPISQGFWDAAARGQLAISRCVSCQTFQHPPTALCRACGSTDFRFEPMSGKGRLWSWTITHRSVLHGFDAAMPYTCILVELQEQPGLFLVSDLIGREFGAELKAGLPVTVVFPEPNGDGPVLPQFVADVDGART